MDKPERILHIEIRGGVGGIETFLLNLYNNIDKSKVQFDFISTSKKIVLENKFTSMGSRIYKIPEPKNIISYYRSLKNIIKSNNYNIVHIHKNSAANILPFIICKKLKIKCIISHSHNTAPIKSKIVTVIFHKINKFILNRISTKKFACSNAAAEWLYGKKYMKKNNIEIINNGIEVNKFIFNENIRNEVRFSNGWNNKFVIGHVGRMMKQKNQSFLVDIFEEILKIREDAVLVLCGTGELEEELHNKVKRRNLEDKIYFMGIRSDINNIMQAMDVFVLPSLYEGLGIVAIEAQATALPTICSDNVPIEAKILDTFESVSLKETAEYWAKIIIKSDGSNRNRSTKDKIKKAGYDISSISNKLQEFYMKN
jgi:glycosyltransferase involved in cell wall biosynthesis